MITIICNNIINIINRITSREITFAIRNTAFSVLCDLTSRTKVH